MCRYLECKLTDWKDNQNSQVAQLVDVVHRTMDVKRGNPRSIQVRILS
jgi:hypothetical protein